MATILALIVVSLLTAGALAARRLVVWPRLDPAPGLDRALTPAETARADRLRAHVTAVASLPHNIAHPAALEDAACYIERELQRFGLAPRTQCYRVDGIEVRNIDVVIPASAAGPGHASPTYVLGAHYDSPDDCPGANDNGTGVAALLELAYELSGSRPRAASLRLAFFVNEEQPYGKTEQMGSWRYARSLAEDGEVVAGMIALETLGFFSDVPGSQRFPVPFNMLYPDRGNFVAFVALPGARAFLLRAIGAFRGAGVLPSIGGVVPGFVPGADLSDHWSFRQHGYPALMLTDTAPYRNPHYHQLSDTPETVDYAGLSRVTGGVVSMVRDLAGIAR